MPLTVTATPLPDVAAVQLVVAGAVDGQPLAGLTRYDVNGAAAVRLRPGQVPNAGQLAVVDHEAALSGAVRYTARLASGELAETSTALELSGPRLVVPVLPQLYAAPLVLLEYDAARESTGSVDPVVASDRPAVTLGPLTARAGRLELLTGDASDAAHVVALYAPGDVVLLRTGELAGHDLYHVARRVAVRRSRVRWLVTVDYAETDPPVGPQLGTAGWDYADALAGASSYAALRDAWPDYLRLALGPLEAG